MKRIAVVLMSGGLDSSTVAYVAKEQGYEVWGLTFNRGQSAFREIFQASNICIKMGIKQFIVDISSVKNFQNLNIKEQNLYHVVPFRNAILLTIAVSFAQSIDADAIFMGTQFTDASRFPDGSLQFIETFRELISAGTAKHIHKIPLLLTPFIHCDKSQIIHEGIKLGVPYELTWSCYFGNNLHCGKCSSCIDRINAFKKANIKDPTKYEGGEINGIKKGNKNI